MLLISFLDGVTLDPRQEEAVARSVTDRMYFTRAGDVLRAVPDCLVWSKIYPQGIVELPLVIEYVEAHLDEIDSVDYSLTENYLDPVLN